MYGSMPDTYAEKFACGICKKPLKLVSGCLVCEKCDDVRYWPAFATKKPPK